MLAAVMRDRAHANLRSEIIFWYGGGEGLSVVEISAMLGVSRSTVYRHLHESGAKEPKGTKGRPTQEKCARGHLYSEWGMPTKAGRACRACKRQTDRESARRRYNEKKAIKENTNGA